VAEICCKERRAHIQCTGKVQPTALFIPTASDDAAEYREIFQQVYGKQPGCKTDFLFLIREQPSIEQMKEMIEEADLIYVGGGNTRSMLAFWRRLGVDQLLLAAAQRGRNRTRYIIP
jgi:dipeptidase E